MRRILYFTYWEPKHDDYGCWFNVKCNTEGKKMQHYYDVQAINATISDICNWLFEKNLWKYSTLVLLIWEQGNLKLTVTSLESIKIRPSSWVPVKQYY